MTVLKIMSGVPASGKTTYIKKHAAPEDLVVSRDKIRYSLLAPGIPYFSKEDEVFSEFCNQINEGIGKYDVIWADATHLNNSSRWKLLYNIRRHDFDEVDFIAIETPLEECLERNSLRGNSTKVPESALKNMAASYKRPVRNDFLSLRNVKIEIVNNR